MKRKLVYLDRSSQLLCRQGPARSHVRGQNFLVRIQPYVQMVASLYRAIVRPELIEPADWLLTLDTPRISMPGMRLRYHAPTDSRSQNP